MFGLEPLGLTAAQRRHLMRRDSSFDDPGTWVAMVTIIVIVVGMILLDYWR